MLLVQAGKQAWIDTRSAAPLAALVLPDSSIKVNGNEIGEVVVVDASEAVSARRARNTLSRYDLRATVIARGSEREDRFKLIVVHTVTQKGCPHGYEKPPDHVDYSPNFLKVVRVREVPSSSLGTPTGVHTASLLG